MNVFPQGDFRNPGAVTEWAEGLSILQNQEFRVVSEFADITITPHLVSTTSLSDAVLPAGISLNWDKTSVETVNAKRSRVSLDGIWRFMPAAEGAAAPDEDGLGLYQGAGQLGESSGRGQVFRLIVARGSGPQWDNIRWRHGGQRLV